MDHHRESFIQQLPTGETEFMNSCVSTNRNFPLMPVDSTLPFPRQHVDKLSSNFGDNLSAISMPASSECFSHCDDNHGDLSTQSILSNQMQTNSYLTNITNPCSQGQHLYNDINIPLTNKSHTGFLDNGLPISNIPSSTAAAMSADQNINDLNNRIGLSKNPSSKLEIANVLDNQNTEHSSDIVKQMSKVMKIFQQGTNPINENFIHQKLSSIDYQEKKPRQNVPFIKCGRLECCRIKQFLHKQEVVGRTVMPIVKMNKCSPRKLKLTVEHGKKNSPKVKDSETASKYFGEPRDQACSGNHVEDSNVVVHNQPKKRKLSDYDVTNSLEDSESDNLASDVFKSIIGNASHSHASHSNASHSNASHSNASHSSTFVNPATLPISTHASAKAIMTTTAVDKGSIVTISIMGKGVSKKRVKPKVVYINTDEDNDDEGKCDIKDESDEENDGAVDESAFKLEENEEEEEEFGETMEVKIRINDSQFQRYGEEGKRWVCHLCPKGYTTKHNLVTHILDHRGIKPHLCMLCGKYFKQLSHLNTHMLTHDNLRPFVCQICNKAFTQVSHLKRHQSVHMESKPHVCDTCGRGFAYPSELKLHKEKHTQGVDQCTECECMFDSPRALKLHMVKHENREDLICKYCDKPFRYPSQLKDHLISHEGARPYMCTECGMDFMKEHHLRAHQFTHTGQKPHSCELCGRSFNQRANMLRHMLIHDPKKSHECDVCKKMFTQPQTLKAHMVVHQKEKPYRCKLCGKQFGRLHNLQGHMHIHNNSKPYACFCGSSFTLKGNLNRHKKVKHGLDESTESMEEEAVHFLNNLSGHLDHSEHETDDVEFNDCPDQGEVHKRKSIPRKIIRSTEEDEYEGMSETDN